MNDSAAIDRRRRHLALAGILALTVLVYLPSIGHSFQFDDKFKIQENPRLANPRSYVASFGKSGYSEDTTRFLPNLTFCLNYALFGLKPAGYHLTNLLFHLLNIWLVSRLARTALRRMSIAAPGLDLLAAAVFALHPLNSEAVLYCNARPNVMATTFVLLTILNFLRAMGSPEAPRGLRVRRWATCALTLILALLCKEMAATVVLLAPLLYFWGGGIGAARVKRVAAIVVVMTAAALTIGALTGTLSGVRSIVTNPSSGNASPVANFGMTVLTQSEVFVRYLVLALLPLPRFLNVFHPVFSIQKSLTLREPIDWFTPSICLLLIVLSVVGCFRWRRRAPLPTYFALWMVLAHAPTSLFPRGEAMVEYRTYLPMVGGSVLLAWGIHAAWTRLSAAGPLRRLSPKLAALVLVLLMGMGSFERAEAWKTPETLWADAMTKTPTARSANNLATILQRQGRIEEAARGFRQAYELDKTDTRPLLNLGMIFMELGAVDRAEVAFQFCIKATPEFSLPYYGMGMVLAFRGDHAGAVPMFEKSLTLGTPTDNQHSQLATSYLRLGRLDDAERQCRDGMKLTRAPAPYYRTLASIGDARGRTEEALEFFKKALESDPVSPETFEAMGIFFAKRGAVSDAMRALERALQLNPDSMAARVALAALCRKTGDAAGAEKHLAEVARLKQLGEETRRNLLQEALSSQK